MNRRAIVIIPIILLLNFFFISMTVFSMSATQAESLPDKAAVELEPVWVFATSDQNTFLVNGRAPTDVGGGEYECGLDEITDAQRQQIETAIAENQARLRAENRLPQMNTDTAVPLSWPVQPAAHLDDFGYHGIANFVDQNGAYPNALLDFACGQRTYDTYNGYNHPGTDIFTWPFPWNRMDNNEVIVVAAAPGIIVYKEDGNYDRNCSFTGTLWNAVYVQHADGSVAWYGHLKNGSVTSKPVGAAVSEGEYLGVVGSSGSSTAPHLHFELHGAFNQTLDPYAGACNYMNTDSLWVEQRPYYDSAVNLITTGYAAPLISSCSTPEQSRQTTEFNPGDAIYFTTYYRDQLGSLPSTYTIFQPDGNIYQQWTHGIPASHYAASWWYWSFDLEQDAPQGYWQFEVAFNSQVYTHTFLVGTPPPPPPPAPPAEPPPVITVTLPNGGEVYAPGSILTTTWSTVLTEELEIDLYWNEMFSRTLGTASGQPGIGNLTWTIPISTPASTGYKIRVSNALSSTVFDESDHVFVIGILDNHLYLPAISKK